MTLEKQRAKAKFLDAKLDEETARKLSRWNYAILAAALVHDGDHIRQAYKWGYHIPLQLWLVNLVVYVLPTVTAFLVKNRRTSAYASLAACGAVTSTGFLKIHLIGENLGIWGIWDNNYFKLMKGITYQGKYYKGVDWISWALLLDLPVICTPAIKCALEGRKAKMKELENKAEE